MTGLAALEAELGSAPPAGFARLSEEEVGDLAAAVHDARRRQAVEVTAAGDRALGIVPRFLRGPIRKIMG
jgi:hypothetical protein